jgi:hypothetical protein
MTVLGGSLFQLLVPAALMLAFVYKYKTPSPPLSPAGG